MYRSKDDLSPSCSSLEDLVSYLYGEMKADEQTGFEEHLGACEACTAEFADLSLARLGVYEWHRDEFAVLATPDIVIPYDTEPAKPWLQAVRSLFASPARWAPAGALAALVVLAGGFWMVRDDGSEIVSISEPRAVSSPEPVIPRNADDPPQPERPAVTVAVPASVRPRGARQAEVVTAVSERTQKPKTARPASAEKLRPTRPAAAPRLNDFDDEDDTTLRLGDLLAEVDTRDE